MTRAVAELSHELGHPPAPGIIAARLGQGLPVMEAALKALVSEGALEADASGGYRVSPNIRQMVTIGPAQAQPELFAQDSGNHQPESAPPERLMAEELAAIEGSAQEENDGETERGAAESGQKSLPDETDARSDQKPLPSERPARRQRQKTQSAPGSVIPAQIGRWQIAVIRAVMAASGLGASIVSGYFAILRLAEFMPRGLAAVLGSFLVAFAVIAFETVLVFVQRKGYFIAGLFVVLWAIVAAFTLTATVAGFYSYYAAVRIERARSGAGEEAQRSELEGVRQNEEALRERILAKQSELRSLQKIVEDASQSVERRAEYGRVFYDAENRILAGGREIDRLQAALDVERKKENGILAEAPAAAVAASRPSVDFYDWVGSLLSVKPDTMELVSALFPSMFIDLISSIGLAVALFLSADVSKRSNA